jgi:hypothetical protein
MNGRLFPQMSIVLTFVASLNAFASVVLIGVLETALLVAGASGAVSLMLPEAVPHAASNMMNGVAINDLTKPIDFPSTADDELLSPVCSALKSLASLSFWLCQMRLTAIS